MPSIAPIWRDIAKTALPVADRAGGDWVSSCASAENVTRRAAGRPRVTNHRICRRNVTRVGYRPTEVTFPATVARNVTRATPRVKRVTNAVAYKGNVTRAGQRATQVTFSADAATGGTLALTSRR